MGLLMGRFLVGSRGLIRRVGGGRIRGDFRLGLLIEDSRMKALRYGIQNNLVAYGSLQHSVNKLG